MATVVFIYNYISETLSSQKSYKSLSDYCRFTLWTRTVRRLAQR
ncbi:hypothetical protein SAMN02745166_02006 [Prosthecobacter debontii]|uniref:Uncharacterized protein n=1 Tax=Prosthecobacter debontii TaxID=48467 RepID=A0A1T4XUT3_9BACT|nr:hypothetical protein SAMN02745166_02006 [Prosthecobacter debontii]